MIDLDGTEVVGYVASALVVLSLAMTSVVRLRAISLAGAVTFVAYGLLIGSVPIVVTNGAIAVLNVWFLSGELGRGAPRRVDVGATVIPATSPYLHDFVRHHLADIHRFQPDFSAPPEEPDADAVAMLLTRDALPAGLLLGHREGTTLNVDLDYVLAPYRDTRLRRWLYGPGADVFRRAGFTRVRATARTETHRRYLQRSGFAPDPDGTLVLDL